MYKMKEWSRHKLHIQYNKDANVVKKHETITFVFFKNVKKIPTILVEKIATTVHKKRCNTVTSGCISMIQPLAVASHSQLLIKR